MEVSEISFERQRECVAVAKFSKALASFFCCVRSRNSPDFEPSHGAHRQAILVVVEGGCGHKPQHITCSVWADSARYTSKGFVKKVRESMGMIGGDNYPASLLLFF